MRKTPFIKLVDILLIINLFAHFYFRITSQINQGSFPSITMEMTSCTQCSSCRSVLYDEELMSGWSCDEADYKTTCPYCGFQMVASLTINITKVHLKMD